MPKKLATTIQTREELEAVMGEYARASIARGQLALALEEKLQLARKDYEARLADFDAEIETLLADLEAWAVLHPGEFADRKSIDLVHGAIGFRTGNPTLKPLKGVKWEHVVDMLKASQQARYLRSIEEVNKDAILTDREALGADRLKILGLRIEQTERFFAEARTEPAAPTP
jgi:phage host-nuclease inhibitor protein Gam